MWFALGCPLDTCAQLLFGVCIFSEKCLGIGLVEFASLDNLHSLANIMNGDNINAESEAVGQLWAQLALFRIHGADQDETGRMAERDALALHDVDAHRGGVEQDVNYVVVQQIDFINVENAS